MHLNGSFTYLLLLIHQETEISICVRKKEGKEHSKFLYW